MCNFTDQLNNTIRLESSPCRIVSLVPSQTELLYDLGLGDRVVGITKFCIHPKEWFRTKSRVGGTKNIDIAKIKALQPDLIIGNKEENDFENIESLRGIAPIWMSDISNLSDAYAMIASLGKVTNSVAESLALIDDIKVGFNKLKNSQVVRSLRGKSVHYFIWHDPDMVAGKSTFIDAMLLECGLHNLTKEARYPEVDLSSNPDFIFLSSEPFPFKEKHLAYFKKHFSESKLVFVDGEMFSWYGSRLKKAPEYFESLLNELTN
ncbi:MAG: helical backbone metal receptor [Crocinitomicaceae bacterium]|nr:helical backbone metal receptor [Crocinitomicaceae bacterium]MDG1776810.1 helical backbone metal receptor [Crocinitomicaceae bacterium]